MQENLKDILSNLSTDVDQEALLQYLQGKLTAEQQHQLEKQMLNSDFDTDALEGLQSIKNKQQIKLLVDQLNSDLKKKTKKKASFKEKLSLKNEPWLLISVAILLLLLIISYIIIYLHL